jgi:hypothetical protein
MIIHSVINIAMNKNKISTISVIATLAFVSAFLIAGPTVSSVYAQELPVELPELPVELPELDLPHIGVEIGPVGVHIGSNGEPRGESVEDPGFPTP